MPYSTLANGTPRVVLELVQEDNVYQTSSQSPEGTDALGILLPILFVLSTLLFVMLLFLVCILLLRRRRGISLRDSDGPVDVSRDDVFNDADGGLAGIEERWLETVSEEVQRSFRQAKIYEAQYPPNSVATDITLSQFLSIQEKGVSAWSFEPEYEALTPVLVHARTELTFLPDPSSSSSVQSNLPIPKLNEVYYWEVKMFDLPSTTNVAVGLATKPYPTFRLPGWNRYSVAYHSSGDKSYNYPFTATPFGPPLREGDVLGVGYRPRTGVVFFTRNGRKTEEAFAGLQRWNLFPTVGADGPCTVHVNLGQAGFVFIEANVKKWGLAPSVGTLAPPPAYGSERGSILLEAGGMAGRNNAAAGTGGPTGALTRRTGHHRMRRPKAPASTSLPSQPSALHTAPLTPPPPFSPGESRSTRHGIMHRVSASTSSSRSMPSTSALGRELQTIPAADEREEEDTASVASSSSSQRTARNPASPRARPLVENAATTSGTGSHRRGPSIGIQLPLREEEENEESDSPYVFNPPTPNVSDIHLRTLDRGSLDLGRGRPPPASSSPPTASTTLQVQRPMRQGSRESNEVSMSEESENEGGHQQVPSIDPPGYAVINPHIYASGVHIDLPAEVIQAALDGRPIEPPELSANVAPNLNPGRGARR
ncbi:Rsp5p-dependent ubiquitination, sorting of cargo proteins at the multivesicular body [Serendipita sp. 401]|nr:Rsp5p-dependent ubiquitination, sorting of cargo proteins at the multivesicular body [Serendipita sp. 401]